MRGPDRTDFSSIASTLIVTALAVVCTSSNARAQGSARASDSTVLSVMRRSAPELTRVRLWQRQQVSAETDIVLALAWPDNWGGCETSCESAPVGSGVKLGLFTQDRNARGTVYILTIASDLPECFARVLRISSTDLVLSCQGEKSEIFPHLKFLYDTRRRALVTRYQYEPYWISGASLDTSSTSARVRLVARSSSREVAFEIAQGTDSDLPASARRVPVPTTSNDAQLQGAFPHDTFGPSRTFRLVEAPSRMEPSETEPVIESTVSGRTRQFRLPQTSYHAFEAARPEAVKMNPGFRYSIEEQIGPSQVVDGKLWFGKTFYDGEGFAGVGGLGYFDPADRAFHVFTGSAIADWSVLHLLVEPAFVWASLDARGEWGDVDGGVVRFDRKSATFERISQRLGGSFLRVDDEMMLAIGSALTVIRGGRPEHYFIDETPDGQPRIVPLR